MSDTRPPRNRIPKVAKWPAWCNAMSIAVEPSLAQSCHWACGEPIELPDGLVLVTLRDAGDNITKFPKSKLCDFWAIRTGVRNRLGNGGLNDG